MPPPHRQGSQRSGNRRREFGEGRGPDAHLPLLRGPLPLPRAPLVHQALHVEDREHGQEYMDKMSSKISETKKANVSSSKRSGGKLSLQTVFESCGQAMKWIETLEAGRVHGSSGKCHGESKRHRRGTKANSRRVLHEPRLKCPALLGEISSRRCALRKKEPSMEKNLAYLRSQVFGCV